jgi:hypothetical protein
MNIAVIGYLYVLFIILAFLADRLPFLPLVKSITLLGMSSLKTIRSVMVTDSQKEKLLLANSLSIFIQSLKIIVFITLIVVCGLLLLLIISFMSLNYTDLVGYVITFKGLVLSATAFLTYYLLKGLYVKIRL